MQEGGAAQGPAVGQGGGPLGGVENQLNFAVFDGVDDVGTALEDLVDLVGGDAVFLEITLGPPGGDDLEAQPAENPHGFEDSRLVGVSYRDEHGSRAR